MSSFFGQTEISQPSTDQPVRDFAWCTSEGQSKTAQAHYVSFMPEHVTFWIESRDGIPDRLVLAEANRDVNGLHETSC